jgi:transposase
MLRPADSLAPHKELRCHRALAWISPPVAGQLPSVLALTRVGLSPTSTLHLSGHAVKKELEAFYQVVEESGIPEMIQAIETFRNWQVEILNSFVYGHSNGFLEGINNTTKVIKRNGYGYKNFKRFRARILLRHQYKGMGLHIG